MNDSATNRVARRSTKLRQAKTVAVAGAAATAMTLGLAAAPGALPQALADLNINWYPTYTAGTLAGILNLVGNAVPGISVGGLYNSGPPQNISIAVPDIPLVGTVNLTLDLKYVANHTSTVYNGAANLYNTLGGIPQPTCTTGSYASNCRYAIMLGTSQDTLSLVQAYRAQISSVTTGDTPAGYIPFQASPTSTTARPTQTNQALIFLQNPERPNGGILSRFPGISNALGLNPTMPAAGKVTSADGKIALNTTTVDATWAYDPIGDFPAVFNIFALANSAAAALPLNLLLGGLQGYILSDGLGNTVTTTDIGLNLAAVLQLGPLPLIGTLPMTDGKAYYATLVPNQLPILTPMVLPATIINLGLKALGSKYLLGNPLADAIEPALKILINIAYPDVVPGGAYNRTFLTSGENIPFGSVQPLTPEQKKAVPGDVWNAFVGGVKQELAKPFWGIIVPNPAKSAAAVTSGAAKPAAVEAAAATPIAVHSGSPAVAPVSVQQAPAPLPAATLGDAREPAPSAPVSNPSPSLGSASTVTTPRSQAPRGAASSAQHRAAS